MNAGIASFSICGSSAANCMVYKTPVGRTCRPANHPKSAGSLRTGADKKANQQILARTVRKPEGNHCINRKNCWGEDIGNTVSLFPAIGNMDHAVVRLVAVCNVQPAKLVGQATR